MNQGERKRLLVFDNSFKEGDPPVSSTSPFRGTSHLVVVIWLCFVIRGGFYSTILPLWEGYDEYSHFAFIQHLIARSDLPDAAETRISREIEESLSLVPLPWTLRDLDPPHVTHDEYWRLSDDDRTRREQRLHSIPRDSRSLPATKRLLLYEAQQPPLYYWLVSPAARAAADSSLPARVLVVRWLSVIIASAAVPLGFLIALRVFKDFGAALGATVVIAAMPELMMDVARVGNESLAIVLYGLVILISLDLLESAASATRSLLLGAVLGLGLLTKAYFLAALPALLAVFTCIWSVDRRGRRARVFQATLAFGTAALISAWWYWRNRQITGAWSGQMQDVAVSGMAFLDLIRLASQVDWLGAVDSLFVSHIWFGNWSFLQVRYWIYHAFRYIALLALFGLVVRAVSSSASSRQSERRPVLLLAAFYACFWLALGYHVLITFAASGMSSSAGWYLYCLVSAQVPLVLVGLFAVFPAAWSRWVILGSAASFVLLDLYATHFVLIPYYTGIIAHGARGAVATFHLSQLREIGVGSLLLRLQVNKPHFVSVMALAILWVSYVAATLGLAILATLTSARDLRSSQERSQA